MPCHHETAHTIPDENFTNTDVQKVLGRVENDYGVEFSNALEIKFTLIFTVSSFRNENLKVS